MKTVVIIADCDPRRPVIGGISVYSTYYTRALIELGARVIFIGRGKPEQVRQQQDGIRFIAADSATGTSARPLLMGLFAVSRQLQLPADAVIHAQRPDWILPFRDRPNPRLVTLHGSHYRNVALKKSALATGVYGFLERKGLEAADRIISVSDQTRQDYSAVHAPAIAARMICIPPGIDCARFSAADRVAARKKYGFDADERVALFLGRFEAEKNPRMFLQAVQQAGITGFFVGSGALEADLRQLAAKSATRIVFNSAVGYSQVPEILACADVLGLTSVHEGFPLVLIEAMAAGVPCIVTDAGDVAKIIEDGKTGYRVNTQNIVQKLKFTVENSSRFQPACRLKARSYSMDNYRRVYAQLP